MPHVTGWVFIALNGQRIRSKEGASLNTGGVKREAAISDAGVDGFSEGIAVPRVECKINHTAQIDLKAIHDFKDGTLVFETDSGKVFTLTGAWCANPPTLAKGDVDLAFEAVECLEG
jgi:hypothetical protein